MNVKHGLTLYECVNWQE